MEDNSFVLMYPYFWSIAPSLSRGELKLMCFMIGNMKIGNSVKMMQRDSHGLDRTSYSKSKKLLIEKGLITPLPEEGGRVFYMVNPLYSYRGSVDKKKGTLENYMVNYSKYGTVRLKKKRQKKPQRMFQKKLCLVNPVC